MDGIAELATLDSVLRYVRHELPVLFVPPEVVDVATRSSEPSEFWGGVGVGSGGGAFIGGNVGGC